MSEQLPQVNIPKDYYSSFSKELLGDLFSHEFNKLTITIIPEIILLAVFECKFKSYTGYFEYKLNSQIIDSGELNYLLKAIEFTNNNFKSGIEYYKKSVEFRKEVNTLVFKNTSIEYFYKIDTENSYITKDFFTHELSHHNYVEQPVDFDILKYYYLGWVCNEKVKNKIGYIYLIENNKSYKIGKSNNFDRRFKDYLKTENAYPYIDVINTKVFNYHLLEKELHEKYKDKCIRSEWFKLDEKDVEDIRTFLNQNSAQL